MPVRKGRLDWTIGRRLPFGKLADARRIVFATTTTCYVHDTCERSTCTCATIQGVEAAKEPKIHVVVWNNETWKNQATCATKETVSSTWTRHPTGLVYQQTRKKEQKNQPVAALLKPGTTRKKSRKVCRNKEKQDTTKRWTGKDLLDCSDAESTGSLLASKHRLLLANCLSTTVPTSRPKFCRSCLQFPA